MDDRIEHAHFIGQTEVLDLSLPELQESRSPHRVLRRTLIIWRPPGCLVPKLPRGYCVALRCDLSADGIRRFSPVDPERPFDSAKAAFFDASAFALHASLGGRALAWARNEESPLCSILGYEEARLFRSYAMHRHHYLGRTRRFAGDLSVCAAGRCSGAQRDALPAEIGLDRFGNGTRWTIGRIKEEGRRSAAARGILDPNEEGIVRLGLLAAAQTNPLEVTDAESEVLVRLFKLEPAVDAVTDEELQLVADRVKAAIHKRLHITDAEFRIWIEDRKSSLVRSMERSLLGRLTRSQIQAALLELAWCSVKLFAHSLDVQMRVFREALPEPLSSAESFLFQQCYETNAVFGGLSMLLLHDRLGFLAEVVQDYWLNPQDKLAVAAVRTMLHYYAEIIANRRDADRLYWQRRRATNKPTGAAYETAIIDDCPQQTKKTPPMLDLIREAAVKLLIAKGIIPRSRADDLFIEIGRFDAKDVQVLVYDDNTQISRTNLSRREFEATVLELGNPS